MTLKCTGPKLLTSLATVNSKSPGTLGNLDERQKDLYEPAFYSAYCCLWTGNIGLLGTTWEIWTGNSLWYCLERHGQGYGQGYDLPPTLGCQTPTQLLWHIQDDVPLEERAIDRCPRCLHEVDDATHVWQCQDPRALAVWTQAIAKLAIWMQKQGMQPGMI
jgi:hypothetical protein